MRQGRREDPEIDALIHHLNQRYRVEFDRAEALHAAMQSYQGSRLWPWFLRLRHFSHWLRAALFGKRIPSVSTATSSFKAAATTSPFHPQPNQVYSPKNVSIIIPFRDQVKLLERCVLPLHRTVSGAELVLVDNGSTEHCTKHFLQECQENYQARIIYQDEPFNFSKLCNTGAAVSHREFLLFLNNDVLAAQPNWLDAMLECASDPRVGIVGATLLYPDRTLQHVGLFPNGPEETWIHPYRYEPEGHPGNDNELRNIRTVPAVTGACLLIRRSIFEAVGGFDTEFAVTMNDVDLCQRVKAKGWEVIMTPFARLWHFESLSRGYQREVA